MKTGLQTFQKGKIYQHYTPFLYVDDLIRYTRTMVEIELNDLLTYLPSIKVDPYKIREISLDQLKSILLFLVNFDTFSYVILDGEIVPRSEMWQRMSKEGLKLKEYVPYAGIDVSVEHLRRIKDVFSKFENK